MSLGAQPYQSAVLRAVPDLLRGEGLNVGVVVFSRPYDFLGVRTDLDDVVRERLSECGVDVDVVAGHLRAIEGIAAGTLVSSPISALTTSERFHWLVAPASTVLQPSPCHTGISDDPGAQLERLFARLVQR